MTTFLSLRGFVENEISLFVSYLDLLFFCHIERSEISLLCFLDFLKKLCFEMLRFLKKPQSDKFLLYFEKLRLCLSMTNVVSMINVFLFL